jgi:SAM-dependent methyltransferase
VSSETIQSYYDARVSEKLRGFVEGNARVEWAWSTIEHYAGNLPTRILEIGCGIGDLSWRFSRMWPHSHVVGVDVSRRSLTIARTLFNDPRITFREGPLARGHLDGSFNLIVLVDVYEHIAAGDRRELHGAITDLLAENGRLILAFPTPRHLARLRAHQPDQIQPIDEDITVDVIAQLARDTRTDVLLYKEIGVWHEGDYAHAVLGKCAGWETNPQPAPGPRRRPPSPLVPSRAARLARVVSRLGADAYTATT